MNLAHAAVHCIHSPEAPHQTPRETHAVPTATEAAPPSPTERRTEIDALGARIAEVSAMIDVLDHERLRCIRRFDELEGWAQEGARSCAHWLSWRVGLAPGAAREQVRVARALGTLPLLDGALARREISYS